jgi:hypothetical protein
MRQWIVFMYTHTVWTVAEATIKDLPKKKKKEKKKVSKKQ